MIRHNLVSNIKTSDRWLWQREYEQLHAIPSSNRYNPSKALQLLSEHLCYSNFSQVLDLGCGPGRNSAYLAAKGCNVTGVDFCQAALSMASDVALTPAVEGRMKVINADCNSIFPFHSDSFDFVVDSYLSCHFLEDDTLLKFWDEVARVLNPEGYIYSTVFSVEDEYYQFALKSTHGAYPFVTDPANGITKRLYSEQEFKKLLQIHFDITHFISYEFTDQVLGKSYMRKLFVAAGKPLTKSQSITAS